MRELSPRTLRKYNLYGWPQQGAGADESDYPFREAWSPDARLRIGTSGWAYPHWKGRFYPNPGCPTTQQLAWLSHRLPTVEVNCTYYRVPAPHVFERWRDAVAPGFQFTVKGPGTVTHDKRLQDVHVETEEFLERMEILGDKLACILWQLPPGLHADVPLLARFLDLLPDTMRHAFELRHRSWFERDVYELLRSRGMAFVVHDHNRKGTPVVATADWVYLRLHGPTGRYRGSYDAFELFAWAEQVRSWLDEGREVLCYLNNDERGKSVRNAAQLREMIGAPVFDAPQRGAILLHAPMHGAHRMATSAYSSSARKSISKHIRKHRAEGMPQDQAVAAAMSEARRAGKKTPARKRGSSKATKKATRTTGGTRKQAKRAAKKAGAKSGGGRRKASRKGSATQKKRAGAKGGRAGARKGR